MGTIRQPQTDIDKATDLVLSAAYAPTTGTIAVGNTVELAIEKLDGGKQPLNSTTTITSNTTLDSTYYVVLCNSASNFTVSLPTAVGISGRQYTIKNINTNIVTIDPFGSETIDDEIIQTIDTKYNSITIASNGTNWFIA